MTRIFRSLIAYSILTTAFLWLFVLRGLAMPSADWALFGLNGQGVQGDFWIVALLLLFNGIMLTLGWRGAQPPFHLMLLLWLVTLTVVAISRLVHRVVNPVAIGAAWEPDNWSVVALALLVGTSIAALTFALIWASLDLRRGRPRPIPLSLPPGRLFGSPSASAAGVALLTVPTVILLRLGNEPGWAQPAAVLLSIVQWWLLNTYLLQAGEAPFALPSTGSERITAESFERDVG